jgi:hypothetical protein
MQTTNNCQAKSHRQADKGAILMVVLIVMIALLGLGMTGLFLTSGSIQMNTNINLRNQALVVAEAGIERARGILNNTTTGWVPPVPLMLVGSVTSADEVPTSPTQCQGSARGAILVDQITPSCTAVPTPAGCALQDVAYPAMDRTTDLPTSAGPVTRTAMGTYTVFIRQDQADCRMGNYTCEYAPANGTGGTADSGVGAGGAGGTSGNTTCTVPVNVPPPNGSVVVRSEGLASDGKTRVVLEVTMTPSLGSAKAANTPISALCAAGANGCDDNSSVQNGIVVNSTNTQTPPSNGGTSGNGGSGAGGTTGTGGSPGTGGIFSGAAGNNGGTVGTGGAVGTGGGVGTGGSGTGGNTACPNESCAKIAILGVAGVWEPSSPSGGDAKFASWLQSHSYNCGQPYVIDIESKEITAALLNKYNVIITRDMYHTPSERAACVAASNVSKCTDQRCYRTDGASGLCMWQSATNTSTATSTSLATISGCPTNVSQTATITRTGNWTGNKTGNVTVNINGAIVTGTATYTATATTTVTATNTVTATASTTCNTAGAPTPAAMPAVGEPLSAPTPGSAGLTSYNYGSARTLFTREIDAIEAWVKLGNGIATTSSYYYAAPEVANVNKILARFNLKYGTTDAAGHIEAILGGFNGGGVDVGKVTATINDFVPGSPPFAYLTAVNLLQLRGAVPLYVLSPKTGTGTPVLSAQASYSCPIGNGTYGNSNANCNYTNPSCTSIGGAKDLGYYVSSIGSGGGRVVAWADEWLTYDTVWNTKNNCGQNNYQPDNYWNNVIRWLVAGHSPPLCN